jgi:hypothetical protein
MPIDRVVINASPLITLFRAGLQPLLPKLFPELLVPDSVWNEVVSQAHDDCAAPPLAASRRYRLGGQVETDRSGKGS